MREVRFLKISAVLVLHSASLRDYGGVPGIKDQGLLESALGRPLNKAAYAADDEIDLFELAAAYAYGIARNHAFNDANKRTAWACCVLFLKRNRVVLKSQTEQNVDQMLALAQGNLSEQDFAAWLRTVTAPAPAATPPTATPPG